MKATYILRKFFWLPGKRLHAVRMWIAPRLIYGLARLVMSTLRIEFTGLDRGLPYITEPQKTGVIFVTWHDVTMTLLYAFRNKNIGVMISPSRWGTIQARVANFYGWPTVWGTSGKKAGISALRDVIKLLRTGQSFAFTPDGPKGPRHQAHSGVVFMASHASTLILPIGVAVASAWILPTWDRHVIPKPFSRAHVYVGEVIEVPGKLSRQETEEWRVIVERALTTAQDKAEEAMKVKTKTGN